MFDMLRPSSWKRKTRTNLNGQPFPCFGFEYDNTGYNADLAIDLHEAVLRSRMDGFRNNPVKEKQIKRELYKILKDKNEVERIFKIIVEQEEY